MANYYNSKGNHEKANEHNYKAVNIIIDKYGENHPRAATLYNNIGYSLTRPKAI